MERLYIHCGLPKTGTTSIQKYFAQHRIELRVQGYDYPEIGVNGDKTAHHNLAREILKHKDYVGELGSIADFWMYCASGTTCPNLILSSEGLTHCLFRARNDLLAFMSEAKRRVRALRIIFTFRKFFKIAESTYLDHLKKGENSRDYRQPVDLDRTARWLSNLAEGLAELRKAVGDDNFIICDAEATDSVVALEECLGLSARRERDDGAVFNRRIGLRKAALLFRLRLSPKSDLLTPKQRIRAIKAVLSIPNFPGDTFDYSLVHFEDANAIQSIARRSFPDFLISGLPRSLEPESVPFASTDLRTFQFSEDELEIVRTALPPKIADSLPWLRAGMANSIC